MVPCSICLNLKFPIEFLLFAFCYPLSNCPQFSRSPNIPQSLLKLDFDSRVWAILFLLYWLSSANFLSSSYVFLLSILLDFYDLSVLNRLNKTCSKRNCTKQNNNNNSKEEGQLFIVDNTKDVAISNHYLQWGHVSKLRNHIRIY